MQLLLSVCLGGAVGSGARYLVGLAAARWLAGAAWPWATLMVNVVGCLVRGLLLATVAASASAPGWLRLGLTTGVMGGFTTYSTFNAELLAMLERGQAGRAASYLGATVLLGLAGGAVGLWLGRSLAGPAVGAP
jgi:CrcB protein